MIQLLKAKDLVSFKTGKLDSNAAVEEGKYPFFTCSQETSSINTYAFDTECVLLAGNNANGVFPLKYYKGKFNAYQRTYIIESLDPLIFDISYFFYYLRPLLKAFQQQATGATTKFLTLKILNNLDVLVPPLPTQQKIAAILSAYDDLIENNKRRIALLEKMAEEIYREWFVRFRFPGYQQAEFEKGIPKGWVFTPLNKLLREKRTQVKKKDLSGDEYYLGLEHLSRRSISIKSKDLTSSIDSDKLRFKKRNILMGKIRPYLHKVCIAHFSGTCSTDTIVLEPRENYFEAFSLFTIFSDTFVELANISSNGTKMPRADWAFLEKLSIPIPKTDLLCRFQDTFDPIFSQIEHLLTSSENLEKTKNLLLPRLISGKLSVEELDIHFPPGMQDEHAA